MEGGNLLTLIIAEFHHSVFVVKFRNYCY